MPYTLDISLALGTSNAGLTDLRAQLVDTAGANVGSAVSTGFSDMGQGNYLWHYASFPDGHRGGVKFYSNAAPSVTLAFAAINPEEAENLDTKVSGLVASVWAHGTRTLTSFGTLVADVWSHGTRTLTSFGTLVSDIWSAATRTLTAFGFTVNADMVAISGDAPAADAFETMLDGTGGNKLHLRQLVIASSANEAAIDVTGSGTGAGIRVQGGVNGHGILSTGGAGSGSGLRVVGQASGSRGIDAIGGTDGVGVYGQAGGAGAGIMGGATGTGPGIYGLGGTSGGAGARFQGRGPGADDHGLRLDSANGKSISAPRHIAGNLEGTAQLDMTQAVPTSNTGQTVGDALNAARAQGFGKWVISGTTLTLYAADGTTVVRSFTLDDGTNPTSRT